jgi:sugar phosphate permease
MQNFWRPILISRFDAFASETKGATVLSIESQAKSVSTMIIAPILGAAVDFARGQGLDGEFWPVAAIAAVVALLILLTPLREKGNGEPTDIKIECIGDIED